MNERSKALMDNVKAGSPEAVGVKSLKAMIEKYEIEGEIAKALPKVGVTPERFTRIVMSAVSTNPKLAECDPKSFIGSMISAAQLGLEPNTPIGQAYLIPYGNSCQFQIGYQGLIDLFYRNPDALDVSAETIYSNDDVEVTFGFDPDIKHSMCLTKDRGVPIAYYACWKMKNGGRGFAIMSKAEVEAHRDKYSKAKNSPWDKDFDAMAKKTVIKRALKYAPKTIEMSKALRYDENSMTVDLDEKNIGEREYIDITELQEEVSEQ